MPVMKMMENPSPSPMDLSVPKPNRIWEIQSPAMPSFGSTTQDFYRNPQLISSVFKVVRQPGFFPTYFTPQLLNMQIQPSSLSEITPTEPSISLETPQITPQILKSAKTVMNTPSPSPKSSDENYQVPPQTHIDNLTVKKEIDSSERKRRRNSVASNSSSISSGCEDANNNEKKKIDEPSSTQTRGDFCTGDKLEKTMEKYRRKSRNSESSNINLEQAAMFPKRELVSPEISRLGQSPTSSYSSETDICDSTNRTRVTRPFKAITTGTIMDNIGANSPLGDFETFRMNILSKVNSTNKSTNQNMRRTLNSTNAHVSDPTYWEKRKRNNEAAKRSRDARRRKEDEIAIRCAYLEQERLILIQEIKMLKKMLGESRQQNNARFLPY